MDRDASIHSRQCKRMPPASTKRDRAAEAAVSMGVACASSSLAARSASVTAASVAVSALAGVSTSETAAPALAGLSGGVLVLSCSVAGASAEMSVDVSADAEASPGTAVVPWRWWRVCLA